MVFVPVAHRFPVIVLDAPHRDGGRDEIFGQIPGEPFSAGRNLFFFDKGHEPFRVFFPCPVNLLFHAGVGDVLFEHVQEMVLPFAVDQVERNVGDRLPCVLRGDPAFGEQDVQMGVVDSRSPGGLQDNDGSDVEIDPFCAGFQDIEQASVSGSHERGKQDVRVAVEPEAERLRNRQDDVAVDDPGQHASADEVHPLVRVDLGAGEAEGGLAAEGNAAGFAAGSATVLCEAHFFGIAAIEHLLNHFVMVASAVVQRVSRHERIPVVMEDLLEGAFVDVGFHSQVSHGL